MQPSTGARAAIYARKSTIDQRNAGKSIRDQVRVCREEVEKRGLVVVATFEESGKSASRYARKSVVRDQYAALVNLVTSGEVDVIVMAEQSRGTRKVSELGTLMEASAEKGVRWIVGGREVDLDDPADILLTTVQGGMDAGESSRLSKRSKRGARGAALAGKPPAKNLYGYSRVYDPKTTALTSVEIVPSEAAILREIRDRALAGESLRSIAHNLTDRGILSPRDAVSFRMGRPSRGNPWDPSTVRRIAVNPAYAGLRVHQGVVLDGVKGIWEPIFTPAQHRRLKAKLEAPERKSRDVVDGGVRHFLSGLAQCGECGGPMRVLTNRGRYRSYVCFSRGCFSVSRTAAPLEAMVRDAVIELAARPAIRKAIAKSKAGDQSSETAWAEIESLTNRLEEVRNAIANGTMTVAFAAPIAADLEAKIEDTRKRAEKVKLPSLPDVDRATLGDTFDGMEPGQKRAIASAFVDVVVLKAPKSPKFNPEFVRITAKG
jgi:DNA invertase Pin-like site-specific DNA recombinase